MKKKPPSPDRSRRSLLATASAAGAAAVLAPAQAVVPAAQPTVAPAPKRQEGYRDNERTRRYYALARY